ncbi:unnamed protein product [Cercopithifilaria johnstoni]|uniref:Uncharacterized protein n=1 Tax=Cercopithifilaria johnstoni TaxID=2874296 RepID=A0A8J2MA85_9BILA|nr:unnamed protein product [Cercopithifilaria johnstoni]
MFNTKRKAKELQKDTNKTKDKEKKVKKIVGLQQGEKVTMHKTFKEIYDAINSLNASNEFHGKIKQIKNGTSTTDPKVIATANPELVIGKRFTIR